jgi:N-acetylglutamate synthase-like GNAT family acetyltransferase
MDEYTVTICKAGPEALPAILDILSAVGLPHDGVADHLSGFLLARAEASRIAGCIGLERHGELGLLRSAAVLPEYQGRRIGHRMISRLLDIARDQGITEVVLLTTTAASYFHDYFGFEESERSSYRDRLASSPEWNLPRCSSASLMTLQIAPARRSQRERG